MSESELTEAFWENGHDLFRFLTRRLKCPSTARDLAQDLFLKIKGQDDTIHIRNRKAYFFRMAANLSTDYLRVEQRRSEILAEAKGLLWEPVEQRHSERVLIACLELVCLEHALPLP